MTDQVVINFPEMPQELENFLLEYKDKIIVNLWKSDEREVYPLKWEGSQICCPVKMWFDFPKNIHLTNEEKDHE